MAYISVRGVEHYYEWIRSPEAGKTKPVMVFVHGFNNSFEEAAQRAGQRRRPRRPGREHACYMTCGDLGDRAGNLPYLLLTLM